MKDFWIWVGIMIGLIISISMGKYTLYESLYVLFIMAVLLPVALSSKRKEEDGQRGKENRMSRQIDNLTNSLVSSQKQVRDLKDRNEILASNLRFTSNIVKSYRTSDEPLVDVSNKLQATSGQTTTEQSSPTK